MCSSYRTINKYPILQTFISTDVVNIIHYYSHIMNPHELKVCMPLGLLANRIFNRKKYVVMHAVLLFGFQVLFDKKPKKQPYV